MMINVEQSVELEVLGENLPQFLFVHHKSHMRDLGDMVGSWQLTE
jgi:hypothetical protein